MEPQQTNPNPAVPPPKPNHKIFYILIFIFIALVGSSAYLFLQNPKKEVAQSVPVQNGVEEWKTYRNEEYGFEFKYPVTNNPYIKDIVTYPEGDFGGRLLALEVGSNDDGLHTSVAFVLVTDNSETELSDFQDTKRYKKIIDEELMTNGVLWKLVEYEILYPADINFTRIASYKSKNYTYSISTAYDREKFNKILSTFKFIDKADTSTWKTYRNEEYGIEFKYPGDWVKMDNYQTDPDLITIVSSKEAAERKCYEGCGPDLWFYVHKNTNVEKYIKDPGNLVYSPKKISIDNHIAYEVVEGGYDSYYVILVQKGNDLYEIFAYNKELSLSSETVESQILKTFKFTK